MVLDWESDHAAAVKLEAGVHHKTIIIVPEESPEAVVPALGHGADSGHVDEVVPNEDGETLEEISLSGGDADGGNDGKSSEISLLILFHI